MKATRRKKSYEELVDAIIDALPVRRSGDTVTTISQKIGSSWDTTWRWLQLIVKIQGLPEVHVEKSPLGRGDVYRRERAEYGSRRAG